MNISDCRLDEIFRATRALSSNDERYKEWWGLPIAAAEIGFQLSHRGSAVLPSFVPSEEVMKLKKFCEQLRGKDEMSAAVRSIVPKSEMTKAMYKVRGDFDCFRSRTRTPEAEHSVRKLLRKLLVRVANKNKENSICNVCNGAESIESHEVWKEKESDALFTFFPVGSFVRRTCDNRDQNGRALRAVLFLEEGDGADFELFDDEKRGDKEKFQRQNQRRNQVNVEPKLRVKPEAGKLLLFRSDTDFRVSPAKQNCYCVSFFFYNEKERQTVPPQCRILSPGTEEEQKELFQYVEKNGSLMSDKNKSVADDLISSSASLKNERELIQEVEEAHLREQKRIEKQRKKKQRQKEKKKARKMEKLKETDKTKFKNEVPESEEQGSITFANSTQEIEFKQGDPPATLLPMEIRNLRRQKKKMEKKKKRALAKTAQLGDIVSHCEELEEKLPIEESTSVLSSLLAELEEERARSDAKLKDLLQKYKSVKVKPEVKQLSEENALAIAKIYSDLIHSALTPIFNSYSEGCEQLNFNELNRLPNEVASLPLRAALTIFRDTVSCVSNNENKEEREEILENEKASKQKMKKKRKKRKKKT
eukprot:g6143.t1